MGADGRPSSGPALAAEWRAVVLPWKRTWAISTGGPLVWLYGADDGEVKRLWASDTDDWLPKLRSRKTPPLVPVPDKDIGVAGRLLPPEASLFNCRAPSPGSLALRRLRMHLYISAATTRNTTTETDEDTTVFILLSPPELSPEISPKLPE
ncbi:hypothetical protein GGF44_006482 [Coemansia sp. RSA 1694]|nr:hypothetical protein GGF44_006482 [Coemansia sp. RSA 1694]